MSLSAQVTAAGISAPSYVEILTSLQASFRSIYGADAYIEPDSQDGQFLAILASAINDCNDAAVTVFNAFSPAYSQGTHLSSLVKINGIARLVSSYSTAPGIAVGVAGTIITNGTVADENGNSWNLPASVVIPPSGSISVTVTAQDAGEIVAPSGSINQIGTPTLGWQSFVSTADATLGAPVEKDSTLRQRQAVSTSLPAQTPMGALLGALLNLDGVQRCKLYENAALTTDENGLPGKSICVVIEGGALVDIAQVIGQKKTPGAATYGTTLQVYTDPVTGIPYTINFFILAESTIKVNIALTARTGYTSAIGDKIKAAIADHINARTIGETVEYARMWAPAYLTGAADGLTYEITAMTTALGAGTPAAADIPIDFNKSAACLVSDITLTIS